MASTDNIYPDASWAGVAGGGAPAVGAESAAVRGAGFTQKAIGNFDDYTRFWFTADREISVACDTGDQGFIQEVEFWCEGRSVVVSSQTLNARTGTIGYSIVLKYSLFQRDGDAQLYAFIRPVNGYERRIGPLLFTVQGTGINPITKPARYVDGSKNVAGAVTSGAFTAKERITQAVTLAEAYVVGAVSGAGPMKVSAVVGAPNSSGVWTGITSGATFTPTAIPVALGSDTYDGTSAAFVSGTTGPWASIMKASAASPSTGADIYVAAGRYNEDNNTITLLVNTRLLDFHLAAGLSLGDVIISRSTRVIQATGDKSLDLRVAHCRFDGFEIDAGRMVQLNGSRPAGTYVYENCRVVDSNGVSGPAHGYYSPLELTQIFFRETEGQVNYLINTYVANYITTGARVMRGTSLVASADAIFMSGAVEANNTTVINTTATQVGVMYQRRHLQDTLTVGSISYNASPSRTTITWAAPAGSGTMTTTGTAATFTSAHGLSVGDNVRLTNGSQAGEVKSVATRPTLTTCTFASSFSVDQVATSYDKPVTLNTVDPGGQPLQAFTFLTGVLTGVNGPADTSGYVNGWPIYSQTPVSAGVAPQTVLSGDARSAVAGDTAWGWIVFHADSMQVGRYETTGANMENIIFQRYKATGPTFQGLFFQSGSFSGPGTITTIATALTSSLAHGLLPNDFVRLTSGSQINQYRRVITAPTSTTATLASAFTVDQTTQNWVKGKTIKDLAIQLCIFDHTSAGVQPTQWENGQCHVVIRQSMFKGAGFNFSNINNPSGFGLEGCFFRDSIFSNLDSDASGPGFPGIAEGITIDNNHFETATARGTNNSLGLVTYTPSYYPSAGVTRTIASPKLKWDFAGNAMLNDGTDLVGAVRYFASTAPVYFARSGRSALSGRAA